MPIKFKTTISNFCSNNLFSQRTTKKIVGGLTLCLFFTAPAIAEKGVVSPSTKSASIAGSWVFETGSYNQNSCRLTGQMIIKPSKIANRFSCEFTTYESCLRNSAEIVQNCSVLIEGDQAAFVSKIIHIADQKPSAYPYAPDDWRLTIKSNDEMIGTLESASRAYVIFKRDTAPTS